jgi:hypothetical protein
LASTKQTKCGRIKSYRPKFGEYGQKVLKNGRISVKIGRITKIRTNNGP